jgi:hypothetical protein
MINNLQKGKYTTFNILFFLWNIQLKNQIITYIIDYSLFFNYIIYLQ